MPKTLNPTDVPRLADGVQLAALPGGRMLARHTAGVTLLGGVALDDLRRVLTLVDGQRTVAAICEALGEVFEEDDVRLLLGQLLGDVLHLQPPQADPETISDPRPPSAVPVAAPMLVVGHGAAATFLFDFLKHRLGETVSFLPVASFASCRSEVFLERERDTLIHFSSPPHTEEPDALTMATVADLEASFRGQALVVCLLEGVPYRALFDVQEACLRARVPGLFVTADPDGLRIGPTVIPGPSPCIACAQIANVRFLTRQPARLQHVLAHFRTLPMPHPNRLERLAQVVAAEARAVLTPDGRPALTGQVMRITREGTPQQYAVLQEATCPVCGTMPSPPTPQPGPRTDLTTQAALTQIDTLSRRPRIAVRGGGQAARTSVCILGGGTAGYLTALALRKKHPRLDVTLIESSRVPVIGVGEATTPLMPQFLHADLGLDVHDFFREVQPTLKLGIRFDWGAAGDGTFNYPFGSVHVLDAYVHDGDVRTCSLPSMMMTAGVLPVWEEAAARRSRLGTEIAYHLENRRFVRYLQRKAADIGVHLIDAMITDVHLSDNGETVEMLIAEDHRRFAFDVYVDCSGFRSMLMGKALGSRFVGYEKSLFTDGAVVAKVPRAGRLHPYTTAEAMDAGWCWNTPQIEADHRGYVFSSAFLSPDEAVAEMQRKNPGMGTPRVLRFRPGRHEHFWKGNVIAMGNAYGFVEPLESTALHMLIRQIGLLVRAFPLHPAERSRPAILNRKVNAYWDYLGWFLALHYKFNQKQTTPFWQACRADVDIARHAELIDAFHERGPLSADRTLASAFDYPDPLWGADGIDLILLGQHAPTTLPPPTQDHPTWTRWRTLCQAVTANALPQTRVLALFNEEPALLDRFADAFKTVGPAFGIMRTTS